MIPDADLQLSVAIKALRDVVAPAVDSRNSLAVEQLHLALATLDMVRSHLPLLHAVARRELGNALGIAEAAAGAAHGLDDAIASGHAVLDDPSASPALMDERRVELLELVGRVVRDAVDPSLQRRIARAVVAASKPQCDLSRAWCLAAGFELDVKQVPALEALLADASSRR